MERLKEQYTFLMQAYKPLSYAIKQFSKISHKIPPKSNDNDNECTLIRDALIQRFEFCYDLTWKFLKNYLEDRHAIEVASPKKVFQECIKQNLIPSNKTDFLMEIVEARNNTAHTYNEEIAHDIAHKIPEYFELMKQIIKNLSL